MDRRGAEFRMLVLQSLHGLSLEATERLVRDRLSWMRFCGLGLADPVPDANTLWDFREALIRMGALEDLFRRLDQAINGERPNAIGLESRFLVGRQAAGRPVVTGPSWARTRQIMPPITAPSRGASQKRHSWPSAHPPANSA